MDDRRMSFSSSPDPATERTVSSLPAAEARADILDAVMRSADDSDLTVPGDRPRSWVELT
jgi:hypothetical protein